MKSLINKLVVITSDNENYLPFVGKVLRIIHEAYSVKNHPGYDNSMGGQALCDFVVNESEESVPFSLYEYEFKLL